LRRKAMEIHYKKVVKGLVLSTSGRFDALAAVEFDQEIGDRMTAGELSFILDLCRLEYISSSGLRSLLSAAKRLQQADGSMVLCGPRGGVKDVFDMSGFTSIFTIYESVEDFLKA
jgi:anti-sigma B factor antagonist